MMAKPIRALELQYPMIQFIILFTGILVYFSVYPHPVVHIMPYCIPVQLWLSKTIEIKSDSSYCQLQEKMNLIIHSFIGQSHRFSDFILSLNYTYLHARSPNCCILPHKPFFKLVFWLVALVRLSWITIHTSGFIHLKKKTVMNTFFQFCRFFLWSLLFFSGDWRWLRYNEDVD